MKITVRVQPNAAQAGIEQLPDGSLRVRVKAPAQNGKANEAAIVLIARHFQLPKSRIKIVAGTTSRTKLVRIEPCR